MAGKLEISVTGTEALFRRIQGLVPRGGLGCEVTTAMCPERLGRRQVYAPGVCLEAVPSVGRSHAQTWPKSMLALCFPLSEQVIGG